VMYRGGEWFSVAIPSSDERGWVPRDAAQLTAGVAATVPPFPEALPIFVGDIVEDAGEGSVTFTGSLRNVGIREARSVRVLIETLDADGKRVDLIQTSGLGLHIPAGEERSFQVMTKLVDYTTYILRVSWSEEQPDRASPESTGDPGGNGHGRLHASSWPAGAAANAGSSRTPSAYGWREHRA
ncbi:MAG TPA: FxLYD domain-containing protein, partial [Herpetosiphonaceae bacterium]|nr:FxLYD domain-containing protein [Herpetosiphonaceae bacterium]